MPEPPSYVVENTAQRERLRRFVDRLSDGELRRPLNNGWTIATTLAHLAFWDQRALAVLERWERQGTAPMPSDVDVMNAAAHALSAAIPPRDAARLAVESAEAVDGKVERLSEELVAATAVAGQLRLLNRASHRRLHLDELEQALA